MFVATREVVQIAIKKGTKLTERPKDFMLRVRFDKESLDHLDYLCEKHKTDRSKVVRDAIEQQYQIEKPHDVN